MFSRPKLNQQEEFRTIVRVRTTYYKCSDVNGRLYFETKIHV